MKVESNTNTAEALKELMPAPFHAMNLVTDEVIHPQDENSKHRGGLTFTLNINDTVAVWKVMLNFNDLYDISVTAKEDYINEAGEHIHKEDTPTIMQDVPYTMLEDIWNDVLYDAEEEIINAEK
tara:strand:+ start:2416 stop:2787 length:372 start_codon:yes stop_codon:yes gene_type:complete